MSELLEYKTIAILIVFVSLFILERLFPKSINVTDPLKRVVKNLMFWPVNIGLSVAIVLPIGFMATGWHLWARPEALSGVAGFAIDFLILDLFIYCWHRAVHEIQFFWRFHEIHHMDQHLDTTSAIRFHFGEVFFSTLVRMPLIMLLAIPFSSIVIFEAVMFLFVLFHHSNLKLPEKLERYIAKIIVTPSLHWVHHHAIRQDTDSNYGTVFSFWDRLFKSRSKTERFEGMPIGTQGLKDKEFVKLLVRPFK